MEARAACVGGAVLEFNVQLLLRRARHVSAAAEQACAFPVRGWVIIFIFGEKNKNSCQKKILESINTHRVCPIVRHEHALKLLQGKLDSSILALYDGR